MNIYENNIEDYILTHFHYNNGVITRDDRKGGNGSYDKDGYLIIKVKGKQFKAHRLAWLLCYGKFPEHELDHINRDKTDNRIENLRESNRKEQNRNKTFFPNKDTGEVGIHLSRNTKKKYTTRLGGRTYRFYTLEEAKMFRKEKYYECV